MRTISLAALLLAAGQSAWAQLDPDAEMPAAGAGAAVSAASRPSWPGSDAEQPKNNMEMIYYNYGTACLGMDWRFLKAMAEIESGQDPKNHTGKYVGLFQVEPGIETGDTCPMYIKPFKGILGCGDLEDPELNTAVAAHRFHRHFKAEWLSGAGKFKASKGYYGIENVCPAASVADKVAIAYIGHNNGPAVLQHVLKKAGKDSAICTDRDKVRAAVRSFYEDHPKARTDGTYYNNKKKKDMDCADKASLVGKKTFRCISGDYGEAKYDYGLKKAVKLKGIASIYPAGALNPSECPPFDEEGPHRTFPCKDRLTKDVLLATGKVCP